MAENIVETRILLRYGTYQQWMNSDVILKQGEAAIAAFPNARSIANTDIAPSNTPPALGIKIGDGVHYFRELPWIQAVAADVYNWAKSPQKPIYTAGEISGLDAYIENALSAQDGDLTIAPRIYAIVQGTGSDSDKYYLQYKEDVNSGWTIDTSSYIDLSDITSILNWIGPTYFKEYRSLLALTGAQTSTLLGNLDYTDNPVANTFVTSVNEVDGKINVSRAQPTFDNIYGTARVSKGGTGLSSIGANEVLVGTGGDVLKTIPIATSMESEFSIATSNIIKNYVDNAVSGLAGAMHFIGSAAVPIEPGSNTDPQISDYDFRYAKPGDVIISGLKEFVWTGGAWWLLGDEGSYAVKGSITNADIASDASIAITKIAGIFDELNKKVDKINGKQLSTNDYTDEDKAKLTGIESEAQVNTIEHIYLNGTEVVPTTIEDVDKVVNLQIDEFDTESQQKLASIEEGAQVNVIERIKYDGTEIAPDDTKTINITSDPHLDHVNRIEEIKINGNVVAPDANKSVNIVIDNAALNLSVVEGAVVPTASGGYEDIAWTGDKKLILSRIAKTGNVDDLLQTSGSYLILNCGSSTDVI